MTQNNGSIPGIEPLHLADLRKSGLTDDTIIEAGIYSEGNFLRLGTILNRKCSRKLGRGMVFPFYNERGDVVLCRVKPDYPPMRNGKTAKYLYPIDSPIRAYFPKPVFPLFDRPAAELLITEGEKKALAATQAGFSCIGLTGVECWHSKKSLSLIPDLEQIVWKGRPVYIVFDSDAAEKDEIKEPESLLAKALMDRRARVKVARIPAGDNGEKVGLDDFLVAQGPAALRKLLENADDPDPPPREIEKGKAAAADPAQVAQRYLETLSKDEQYRVRFWRECFWMYKGNRYREWPDAEARAHVTRYLNLNYTHVKREHVANVLEQIKAHAIVSSHKDAPCWLDSVDGHEWPPSEILVAKNALVHLPSIGTDKPETAPLTPAMFNTTGLDFKFTAVNDAPKAERWIQFLSELWPDDPEAITALQLWFGYCLAPDTSQQKMLCLFGPKRGGKGTIARVLTRIVGEDNTVNPALSSFAQNFGLWPLIGKSVAIISDARLSGRTDTAVVAERLLSITGEDSLTIDRKYKSPVTCKLPVRLMLMSNELPRVVDASGALVSRMIVLRMTRSWYGSEDLTLGDALMDELPSILWWAIGGWTVLQTRGRLLQPTSGRELIEEWTTLSSPVSEFVAECCMTADEEPDRELSVNSRELYRAYAEWCEQQGRARIEDAAGFGRNLRAVLPGVSNRSKRVSGSRYERHYFGIELK